MPGFELPGAGSLRFASIQPATGDTTATAVLAYDAGQVTP